MSMLFAEIRGVEATIKWLRKKGEKGEAGVRDTAQWAADKAAKIGKQLAPKGATGELGKTIESRVEDDGKKGVAAATAFYAHFVEHGTVKMDAQPFMGPAHDEVLPLYVARLRKLAKEL